MMNIIKTTSRGTELYKWEKAVSPHTGNDYKEGGIFALNVRDGFFVRLETIKGNAPHFEDVFPLIMEKWDASFVADRGTRAFISRTGMSGSKDVGIVTPLKWDEEIYIRKQNASLHVSCAGKLNEGANCPAVCFAIAKLGFVPKHSDSDAFVKKIATAKSVSKEESGDNQSPEERVDVTIYDGVTVGNSAINEYLFEKDGVPMHTHDGCEYWHPIARVHKEE